MIPDFYLCDICQKPTKHRFFFCTGKTFDGAGNSPDGELIDLCDVDMRDVICTLTEKDMAVSESVIGIVKRLKNRILADDD